MEIKLTFLFETILRFCPQHFYSFATVVSKRDPIFFVLIFFSFYFKVNPTQTWVFCQNQLRFSFDVRSTLRILEEQKGGPVFKTITTVPFNIYLPYTWPNIWWAFLNYHYIRKKIVQKWPQDVGPRLGVD